MDDLTRLDDGFTGFKIFRRSSPSFPTTKVYEHDDGRSMEKFTKFRDPGTGIAPFLPIAPGNRTPFFIPIELALSVIRVPLIFMILGLEAILVEGIGEICLRKTVPWLLGWIRWLFLRTILWLCGIWWVDEQLDGVSKSYDPLQLTSSWTSQRKLAIPPKPGNIIASNFTSPLDLIYLAAKFASPVNPRLILGMMRRSFPAL